MTLRATNLLPPTLPRWTNLSLAAALVGLLFGGALQAAEKLQATAAKVSSDKFLTAPEKLDPPGKFTLAKQAPVVEFAQMPLPNTPADPWSIWGYGLLHSNGKFYIPLGDHLGIDANCYIYEYDPATKVLRLAADIQSAVNDYKPGRFGYGKIHGRLNEGTDGQIYFATYWGKWRTENEQFHGDRAMRYDPETDVVTDLGMPEFGWGYPSTHMAPKQGLLYAEAHRRKANSKGDADNKFLADGYSSFSDPYQIEFMAYDTATRKVVFRGAHQGLAYGRDFFVDAEGNAYWNHGDGKLEKYDPEKNATSVVKAKMPGDKIRRTVGPDANGVMYGVTHDTRQLFSFDPKTDKVRTLATVWADSPGMDVTPDGKYIYLVPGGHGPSSGVPLIQVNVATGAQKVIAFLHAAIWDKHHFNLGGTYCVQVSDDGSTVYIGFNGKQDDLKKAWADLALVTVQVPASER